MFTLAINVQSNRFARKQQKYSTGSFTGVFWNSSMSNSSEKGERLSVSFCLWQFVCDLGKCLAFGHKYNTWRRRPADLTCIWYNPVLDTLLLLLLLNTLTKYYLIILIKQWLRMWILWLSPLFWLTGVITDTTQ